MQVKEGNDKNRDNFFEWVGRRRKDRNEVMNTTGLLQSSLELVGPRNSRLPRGVLVEAYKGDAGVEPLEHVFASWPMGWGDRAGAAPNSYVVHFQTLASWPKGWGTAPGQQPTPVAPHLLDMNFSVWLGGLASYHGDAGFSMHNVRDVCIRIA